MSRAEPAPADGTEASVADATTPSPVEPSPAPPPAAVDWAAVRRGCPCATCEAARRGEHGEAPDAGDGEDHGGPPEEDPPRAPESMEGPAETPAPRDVAGRLDQIEARLDERPARRLGDLEERLAHRLDERLARRLDDLEARLARRLDALEARLAQRRATPPPGADADPAGGARVDAAVDAGIARAAKRLERRVTARLSRSGERLELRVETRLARGLQRVERRLDARLRRVDARLARLEAAPALRRPGGPERPGEPGSDRPREGYDRGVAGDPEPPAGAPAEAERGTPPPPGPATAAPGGAAGALGRLLDGLDALVDDLIGPADRRT